MRSSMVADARAMNGITRMGNGRNIMTKSSRLNTDQKSVQKVLIQDEGLI